MAKKSEGAKEKKAEEEKKEETVSKPAEEAECAADAAKEAAAATEPANGENAKEAGEDAAEAAEAEESKEPEETPEEKLQRELDETNDTLLRLKAEYANFRKRSEKEKAETYSFATANVVKELLSVADNLEMALNNKSSDLKTLKKGVKMTYDGMMNTFEKLNIEMYAEKGDKFDPVLHNAVQHVDDKKFGEGEIVEVYQRGCKIGDKIIRPAMVKTAN